MNPIQVSIALQRNGDFNILDFYLKINNFVYIIIMIHIFMLSVGTLCRVSGHTNFLRLSVIFVTITYFCIPSVLDIMTPNF